MLTLERGTIVDGYEIIDLVGRGGNGAVYKALERELDRIVAIKLLMDPSNQTQLNRFRREVQALSRLDHPHIMKCYRAGFIGSHLYVAMEYWSANSLLRYIGDKGNDWQSVTAVIARVCQALDYAHRHGIVHRDVTPANILVKNLNEPDSVKVLDFGLARLLDGPNQQNITATGELIGSVYYMSPEQCTGQEADARSDIYSLGCVLYALLTGEPPFSAENAFGLMHKHVHENQVPPSKLAPEVPKALDSIVATAMAKSPETRYRSMDDFQQDLLTLLRNPSLLPGTARKSPTNNWRRLLGTAICLPVALTTILVCFPELVLQLLPADAANQSGLWCCNQLTALGLKEKARTVLEVTERRCRDSLNWDPLDAAGFYLAESNWFNTQKEPDQASRTTAQALNKLLQYCQHTAYDTAASRSMAAQAARSLEHCTMPDSLSGSDWVRLSKRYDKDGANFRKLAMRFAPGETAKQRAETCIALAQYSSQLNDRAAMKQFLQNLLTIRADEHGSIAPYLVHGAAMLEYAELLPESLALCTRGITIARSGLASDQPALSWLYYRMSRVLFKQRRIINSAAHLEQAAKFPESVGGVPKSDLNEAMRQLLPALEAAGRSAQAQTLQRLIAPGTGRRVN